MDKHMSDKLSTLNMMYSEIKIDEELSTRICILQMMYSVVKPLSDSIIYCEQDDNVTIVNKNGIEIASGTKDTMKLVGIFLTISDINNKTITIYCYSTNKKKMIKADNYAIYSPPKQVGEEFLQIQFGVGTNCIIFNKYLEEIFSISVFYIKTYIQSNSKICMKYRLNTFRDSVGYINRLTGRVESYDSFDLNESFSLLATEYHSNKGVSVNKECIKYFKYKLVKNGMVVSQKSYEDITKPTELVSTDTFYTFEADKDNISCKKKGLIRSDGTELLGADYDEIQYIGANNYILTIIKDDISYVAIYNSEKGVVYNFDEITKAVIHKTLPMTILYLNNGKIRLLAANGIEFNPEEISKYFKCSYSKSRPDLIRIELDYGKKYINNTLVPITNMHEISSLVNHEWIPM